MGVIRNVLIWIPCPVTQGHCEVLAHAAANASGYAVAKTSVDVCGPDYNCWWTAGPTTPLLIVSVGELSLPLTRTGELALVVWTQDSSDWPANSVTIQAQIQHLPHLWTAWTCERANSVQSSLVFESRTLLSVKSPDVFCLLHWI